MYTGRFSYYIIDNNSETEKIISSVPPLEDSEYTFTTAQTLDFPVEKDSAVIICGDYEKNLAYANNLEVRPERTVAVICASQISLDDDSYLKADELWVMPDNDMHNEKLLKKYFSTLADGMKKIFDSRMLKICFDTAFDSIPDLVWFKDTLGAHLMVNDGFCGAVEKTKEQIYKRGHYYIWDIPKEEYEQGEYVCLESEDVVMQARKTCLFDEKVKTKHGMEQFKTYKSPLIDTDGTIFGTCGIAHNVTDLHNVQRELAVILESMPFGVIITDRTGTIVSTNKKLAELEPRMGDLIGMNYVEWKARSVSDARSYIHGGEEIVRSFEGKKYIIWLREVPIYNVFSEYIGHIALFSDITTEREHAQITMQRANTDFLTGLNNRRSLFDYLNKLTDNPKLTIITIDLDNFKKVNDSFGHHMGDEALVETSRTMCRCFHEDFIARLGGDEFLIAIKRNVDLDKTIADTQKLLDTLKQVYSSKHEYSFITASAGICEHTLANGEKHDIDRLIRNSDKALYKAKNSGKDCICVYENE